MVFSSFYHGQPLFPKWFCDRKLSFCDGSAETSVFYSCFFCGGKFRLFVCRFIKPLLIQLFAGLRPSTTRPIFTLNANLSGRGPSILLTARPFGRLKAPLGLSLLRFAAQTRTCRGEAPPSCCARPFCRLKAPLGLSLLRYASQTRTTLFLLCTKSCIVWRKIGVWRSFRWKSIKRKSLKLLGTSRSFRLC